MGAVEILLDAVGVRGVDRCELNGSSGEALHGISPRKEGKRVGKMKTNQTNKANSETPSKIREGVFLGFLAYWFNPRDSHSDYIRFELKGVSSFPPQAAKQKERGAAKQRIREGFRTYFQKAHLFFCPRK
jgi:hypothetical protein